MSRLTSAILCLSLVAFVSVFCCEFKSPSFVGFTDGYLGIRIFFKPNITRTCINFNVNIRDTAKLFCSLNTTTDGSQKFYTKTFAEPLKIADTVYYKLKYQEQNGKECESDMAEFKLNGLLPSSLKENL